jgi:FHA domain
MTICSRRALTDFYRQMCDHAVDDLSRSVRHTSIGGGVMTASSSQRLVIIHPPELVGTILPLAPGRQLLGRGPDAGLRLNEGHLSSVHAAVNCASTGTTVEDLGSRNGTLVNGERVWNPRELRDGDVISFGMVRARYEEPSRPDAQSETPSPVYFNVGQQAANQVNNVGGHQYNNQRYQYIQQRESFLRSVAAARTRSRRLLWLSVLMMIGGTSLYAWGLLGFIRAFEDPLSQQSDFHLFGDPVGGVPLGLIGFCLAGIGTMLFWVALIMHLTAAARGRKVDSDPQYIWNGPRSQH